MTKALSATFHYEFQSSLEALKDWMLAVQSGCGHTHARRLDARPTACDCDQVFQIFNQILSTANYRKLSQGEVETAVDAASDWGVRLHIDFSIFEHLDVYVRGDVVGQRERSNWKRWYRKELVDVPIYQRLVVIFGLRPHSRIEKGVDTNALYVKLFKNIPKLDV